MPSTRTLVAAALVVLGLLVALWSVAVAATPLLGLAVLAGALVLAAFAYYGGRNRRTLTLAAMALSLLYGVVTLRFPAAVVAACVVYLTAWVTGPDGPFDAPDTTVLPVSMGESEDADSANGDDDGRAGVAHLDERDDE